MARYGYTWKKGGWDCMRHLEILGAGTIPVFVDIKDRPSCTLIGYPVEIFEEIVQSLNALDVVRNSSIYSKPPIPFLAQEKIWTQKLQTHFNATLTVC